MEIKYKTQASNAERETAYLHALELILIESPVVLFYPLDLLELLNNAGLIEFDNIDNRVFIRLSEDGKNRVKVNVLMGNGVGKK